MANVARKKHRRLPNPRLVKIHRNYTVEDVARLFSVHKNTVRDWRRGGLPAMTERRPMLILGSDLLEFLQKRRRANKRPCRPGEIFCVRCRAPKRPAGGMADYLPRNSKSGNLVGMCADCDTLIYRGVSVARLGQVKGDLDVRMPASDANSAEPVKAAACGALEASRIDSSASSDPVSTASSTAGSSAVVSQISKRDSSNSDAL